MLDIVVATFNQERELPCLLHSLACQTRRDFNVLVYHDGPGAAGQKAGIEEIGRKTGLNLGWCESGLRFNDWGHSLRAQALKNFVMAPCVLFTNGDNYYVPKFVEYALAPLADERVGVVHFDCVHSHDHPANVPPGDYGFFSSRFEPYGCDIGAMIVRTSIAKAVGWNHFNRDADARFIGEILDYRRANPFDIVKVDKALMVHN